MRLILLLLLVPSLLCAKIIKVHKINLDSSIEFDSSKSTYKNAVPIGVKGIFGQVEFKNSKNQKFTYFSFQSEFNKTNFEYECEQYLKIQETLRGKVKYKLTKNSKFHQCKIDRINNLTQEVGYIRYFPEINRAFLYSGVNLDLKKKTQFSHNFKKFINYHKIWKY